MIKIFSGSANVELAKEVANKLKIKLSSSQITRFDNSEVKVKINEEVKNHICFIIQSTANPTDTHLMELFFFCDALRRKEAKKVIGIIPYFGYARQNIQHQEGECVSANVIIRFLEAIGFSKIYTFDLHDPATEGVFSIPFKNLSAIPLLASEIKKYLQKKYQNFRNLLDNIQIVSPDQGGIERARIFAESFFEKNKKEISLAVIEKKRNLNLKHQSIALDLYGNVNKKIVIIIDDIVTSGKTLINAVDLCLKKGAKEVYGAIVHHDFSPNASKIIQKSYIKKLFTTNTIALNPQQKFEKLHEISIANLIVKEINTSGVI